MIRPAKYQFIVLLTLVSLSAGAQKVSYKLENQLSSWTALNFSKPVQYQLGGRCLPAFSIEKGLKNTRKLDAEASVNTYGNILFTGKNFDETEGSLQLYRLWLRYSSAHFELRGGLQKINFGSATVLRPLMWFDQMDPRDPLQLTNGVYGLLGRYYFNNNANVWLWVLYGNDKPKGWELAATARHMPELGGRVQLPAPRGEIGLSVHHREADCSILFDTLTPGSIYKYPEDRLGVDGKWDVGIGLWFEYVLKHNAINNQKLKEWESFFEAGSDYTFALGKGLNVTAEYFRYSTSKKLYKDVSGINLVAAAANYPLSLIDNISAMVYYDWNNKQWYRFVSLQRTYDLWSFYLMAFMNPDSFLLYNMTSDRNLFAGKGFQLMAVLNL